MQLARPMIIKHTYMHTYIHACIDTYLHCVYREKNDPNNLDHRYEQNIVGQIDTEIDPPCLQIKKVGDER